jgi:FkbM family methyltransferase
MNKGFIFRRIGFIAPCYLRLYKSKIIKLNNKHVISSFQDVFLNPFYWEALLYLKFIPNNVFDLGANFGLFTKLCLQVFEYKKTNIQINYTLIEANKNLVGTINKNFKDEKSNFNLKVLYGAAGPTNSIFFKNDSANLLASKISNDGLEVPHIDFNLLEKPDLLKVDIEGAECLLFENYFDWVKSAKAIIIEFHYDGEQLTNNLTQLLTAGFELKIDQLENSGFRNQLWIKKES